MAHSNATMVTAAFDRITGSGDNAIFQPLNNFLVTTSGNNIIQGAIDKIAVSEVMFPYDVPTIVTGKNNIAFLSCGYVTLSAGGTVATYGQTNLQLTVPAGFYTGAELEAVVAARLATLLATAGAPAGAATYVYDDTRNAFVFENTTTWNGADGITNYFFSIQPFVTGSTNSAVLLQKPRLAWTLGLRNIAAQYPPIKPTNAVPGMGFFNNPLSPVIAPAGYPNVAGNSTPPLPVFAPGYAPQVIVSSDYTGRYTDYIDIVSPRLCQAQFIRDGNTNQATVRRDILCRLYIADEISTYSPDPVGSRPFTIHRQFRNPKVMKWTIDRAIDAIDLQLYDMYGEPLPEPNYSDTTTPNYTLNGGSGNYALTFIVYETPAGAAEANIGYRY